MDAAAELGRNPLSKHQIQPEYGDEPADAGRDLPNPSHETKFSGANGDRGEISFPAQLLTTSRISNLTRLIHILAICMCGHTRLFDSVIQTSSERHHHQSGQVVGWCV